MVRDCWWDERLLLSLQMGEREPRSARLANPRLSFLQRTYEGSVGFLIECPWRLDGPERPICSNLSVLDRDVRSLEEFGWLFMDLTVESFEFDRRAGDLQLHFASGDRLSIFAAEVLAPELRLQNPDSLTVAFGSGADNLVVEIIGLLVSFGRV